MNFLSIMNRSDQQKIELILRCVADYFAINVYDLRGDSRLSCFAMPRQIAMTLIRLHTGLSYPIIGVVFGRDHSTVIRACNKYGDHESIPYIEQLMVAAA